jgi:hypothetical protein
MDLVVNAAQESKAQVGDNYNGPFERAAYIDGVAYMLKGLPRDLDETEVSVLRRSMPPALGDTTPLALEGPEPSAWTERPTSRNLVHSTCLFILVYASACMRWLMPYVLLFFSELMRYEREYKVSENILGTTVAGFTAGLGAMRKIGDGVAGQVLAEAFDYTAEGVSGALKDFAKEVGQQNNGTSQTARRHHMR